MVTGKQSNKVARGPGNPRSYPEKMLLRLVAGTRDRLEEVCRPDEGRADVIRAAIEQEIRRREKAKARS